MLDLHDFGPNPHVPAYGEFGAVTIRWAKGTAGSGPRRRIEAGYDPAFVQTQAGHAYASVTSIYTSVGDDFKQKTIQKTIQKMIQKMIARRIARPEEANPDG